MRHRIANEFDYMIARAERETEHARKILADMRAANDYWREKPAAKLVTFCEFNEKILRLYAEMKLYHPETAELIEERWPHYKSLHEYAKREYLEFQGGNKDGSMENK